MLRNAIIVLVVCVIGFPDEYKLNPCDISLFLLKFSPVRELAVPKGVNCFDYCTKANVIITAGEYTVLYSLIYLRNRKLVLCFC